MSAPRGASRARQVGVVLGWLALAIAATTLNSLWTVLGPGRLEVSRAPWRVLSATAASGPLFFAGCAGWALVATIALAAASVVPRAHTERALSLGVGLVVTHAVAVLVRVASHPLAWNRDALWSEPAMLEHAKLTLWVGYEAVAAMSAVAVVLATLPLLVARLGRTTPLRVLTGLVALAAAFSHGVLSELKWFQDGLLVLALAMITEALAARERAASG